MSDEKPKQKADTGPWLPPPGGHPSFVMYAVGIHENNLPRPIRPYTEDPDYDRIRKKVEMTAMEIILKENKQLKKRIAELEVEIRRLKTEATQ